jgi:hypothetical protein
MLIIAIAGVLDLPHNSVSSLCWSKLLNLLTFDALLQGPGCNDNTLLERIVNVATSLPFVAIGIHSLRCVKADWTLTLALAKYVNAGLANPCIARIARCHLLLFRSDTAQQPTSD